MARERGLGTSMILTITGHRPQRFGAVGPENPVVVRVRRELAAALDRLQPTVLRTGMALGVDQWAAWLCLRRGIPFVAYLPCSAQDARWTGEQRRRYQELLGKAASVVLCQEQYTPGCMHARNRRMVDGPPPTDALLAVWDGVPEGGTWHCLSHASRHGIPATIISLATSRFVR